MSMELSDYLRILRKYWRSITAVTLAGILLAAVATLFIKPTYTSDASLFFSIRSASSVNELNAGSNYAENQVQSFAKVARTDIVLQPVIDELGLDTTTAKLAQDITVTIPAKTATLDLAVEADTPAQAAEIAAAVATRLIATVDELSPPAADGTKPVLATVIKQPKVPAAPSSPNVPRTLAIGAMLGLLLGAGQALLRDLLNLNIRSERDLEPVTDVALLGVIPDGGPTPEGPLDLAADPHGLRAEAYRSVRTNLQFLGLDQGHRAIVVTSSIPGEGKTTTSLHIAHTLAASGERVLVIDADLRRPKIASYLNVEGAVGLTTVLIGDASLEDVVQPHGTVNLDVLASGPIPPNPAELLGHPRMAKLIAAASERYDTVIIDSPPLLPVTDAAVLSRLSDGMLVVVGAGTVKRPELGNALASLERVDARVLGLLLNRVRERDADTYGYRYTSEAAPQPHPDAPSRGTWRSEQVSVA